MRFGANLAEPPRTAAERAWQLLQQLTEVLKRDLDFLDFPCLNESIICVYVSVVIRFGNGTIFEDVTRLVSYGATISLRLNVCVDRAS